MKKPAYKQGVFAGGKSFSELEVAADQAINSGIEYWPKIVKQILRRYADLYAETQGLRQMELFTPPPTTVENPNR